MYYMNERWLFDNDVCKSTLLASSLILEYAYFSNEEI